jgi:CrcB protein
MKFLLVVVGAAVGAPSRFLTDQYLRRIMKYPLGITMINVLGSFVIGLSIGSGDNLKALIAIGFAGAFTTWSTFMLDLYLAFELKQYKRTAINLLSSLVLGLGAAWLGIHLVQ